VKKHFPFKCIRNVQFLWEENYSSIKKDGDSHVLDKKTR